ncbi:MAG: hypothetical protein Q9181_000541 [Wetmoreana brouardii]
MSVFLKATTDGMVHPSPLIMHWIHQAGMAIWRLNALPDSNFGDLENLILKFRYLRERWMAADTYLGILTGS